MGKYLVYSKEDCVYCEKLKTLLNDNDIPHIEKKLKKDFTTEEFYDMFKEYPKTFPKVLKPDGKVIGGYEDFLKFFKVHLSW